MHFFRVPHVWIPSKSLALLWRENLAPFVFRFDDFELCALESGLTNKGFLVEFLKRIKFPVVMASPSEDTTPMGEIPEKFCAPFFPKPARLRFLISDNYTSRDFANGLAHLAPRNDQPVSDPLMVSLEMKMVQEINRGGMQESLAN